MSTVITKLVTCLLRVRGHQVFNSAKDLCEHSEYGAVVVGRTKTHFTDGGSLVR
jgi:hypothetical protein